MGFGAAAYTIDIRTINKTDFDSSIEYEDELEKYEIANYLCCYSSDNRYKFTKLLIPDYQYGNQGLVKFTQLDILKLLTRKRAPHSTKYLCSNLCVWCFLKRCSEYEEVWISYD